LRRPAPAALRPGQGRALPRRRRLPAEAGQQRVPAPPRPAGRAAGAADGALVMRCVRVDGGFADWRDKARTLMHEGVPPSEICWCDELAPADLFGGEGMARYAPGARIRVPREVLGLLEPAARVRVAERCALRYRILWRVAR